MLSIKVFDGSKAKANPVKCGGFYLIFRNPAVELFDRGARWAAQQSKSVHDLNFGQPTNDPGGGARNRLNFC